MTTATRQRVRMGAAVAVIASSAMIASCASTPDNPSTDTPADGTDVSVAYGFLKNVEYAGDFVADDEGYFADAGIAPEFIAGGPNAPAPEVAIASGQAQIAYENNTSRLFSYLAENDDIVIIGQMFQRSPNGLLSLTDRPVRTPEELAGASIIAGAPNRSSIDALMAINGVTDHTFVPGGADIGALQAGEGDALLGFASNQPIALEQQGLTADEDFFFAPFSELNYYLMSDVIIVSRAFLEDNRDVVVDFLRASAKGWEKVFEDPRAAAELTVSTYATDQGLNPDQQEAALKTQIPFMTSELTETDGLFAIDPTFVEEKVYPSLENAGLTNLPDVASVIDMSVLADAQK